ncbi:MAG: UDP-N-acetylmuramoyl-tripeptide--D-alanyl-D-alanine ligase [Bacteroidota bacterium]
MNYTEIPDLYQYFLRCKTVSTDTRKITAETLFVALRGDNFDGNQFAGHALAAGANYAIVSDPEVVLDDRYLLVEDTLVALQALARHHRRQFSIPVLAITGSNGKTTTKELVAGVLAAAHQTHFTQGNFNNHIGVPLTLLAMPTNTEIAVIEMGANHQGEIAALCNIAEPTHGLITNVGRAHLEGFGGEEGVRKGKSELYRDLAKRDGVVFVNLEENYLSDLAAVVARRIDYQLSEQPSLAIPYYELAVESVAPHTKVRFIDQNGTSYAATSILVGKHNLQNINTAITVGKYFKVPAAAIAQAVSDYVPTNNRSEWVERGGIRYWLDAYNANPSSMRAALTTFAELAGDNKRAVLGVMLELGEESEAAHLEIARLAQGLPLTAVYLVGDEFASAAKALHLPHYASGEDLLAAAVTDQWAGSTVLIKGSRGMRLEQLLPAIS